MKSSDIYAIEARLKRVESYRIVYQLDGRTILVVVDCDGEDGSKDYDLTAAAGELIGCATADLRALLDEVKRLNALLGEAPVQRNA